MKMGREAIEKARGLRARLLGQEVTVYPTYGYREPGDATVWGVPMRVWVHDNRDTPFVEEWIERWAVGYFERDLERPLEAVERLRLEKSLACFIADDKSNESVEFMFADDPGSRWFSFSQRTSPNGIIEETIRIPDGLVSEIRSTQAGRSSHSAHWFKVLARTADGRGAGEGRIRFLEGDGLSVVSDIDDTVKITQVPAGKKAVLRNSLLKPYRAAEGMRERYEQLIADAGPTADVCFHYVSGAPWQIYHLLDEFLIEQERFPEGSFHMKNLRKNLFEPGALDSIRAFILGGDLATLDQKVRQITNLMIHLPGRKFILIGDSGEKDPEAYRAIRRVFPEQVQRIIIRDVLSQRLEGMELIGGPDVPAALDTSELEEQLTAQVRGQAAGQ
ncbi:MAG: phosphatidate phosphatase App1 family protein [Verrucomicrobiales bacterium]